MESAINISQGNKAHKSGTEALKTFQRVTFCLLTITLLLAPTLAQNPKNGTNPPLFPFKPTTGYIRIYPEGDNRMFFWLYKSKKSPKTAPLGIWIEGGPGCGGSGSQFKLMGPFYIANRTQKRPLLRNDSWNENLNLLFVDQPLGVGFSTTTKERLVKTPEDAGGQILLFFEGFFEKFPEYKGREIYLLGQSYGGHLVPYAAYALYYSQNPDIRLRGVALGNPFWDPKNLFTMLPDFAYANRHYTGFSNTTLKAQIIKKTDLCAHFTNTQKSSPLYTTNPRKVCKGTQAEITTIAHKFNPKFDHYYLPSNHKMNKSYEAYLNKKDVQEYIGVQNITFTDCTGWFSSYFSPIDGVVESQKYLIPVLNDPEMKVLVYDGDQDYLCFYTYVEKSLSELDWVGRSGWAGKELEKCKYGLCKQVRNLRYLRVAGSGHMMPFYNLSLSLEMINEFLDWDGKSDFGGENEVKTS